MSGVTLATFQAEGKTHDDKDELMMDVMNGSTVLMFSFSKPHW